MQERQAKNVLLLLAPIRKHIRDSNGGAAHWHLE